MAKCAWWRLPVFIIALPVAFILYPSCIKAQDTVSISLQDAEKTFLQNNLSLLAATYNINASQALVAQARAWDNPVISTDQNIYDSQGHFFRHDQANGQVYVQVMQLIRTAGKRNKLAQLAVDNTAISTGQLYDLLRTLRYALVSDLFEIEYLLKVKGLYASEIHELQTLATGMDQQMQSGNISIKDNMRIKALLFALQNELINADVQLMPLQSEVKLLLRKSDTSFIVPRFNYYLPDLIKKEMPSKQELLTIAANNLPDIKIAQAQLEYANHNYNYQKAFARPDINLGTEYDQRSSYAPNYIGLAVSFPLNIFNRNRGNIAAAQFNIKQQQALYDSRLLKTDADISAALSKIKYYQQVNNLEQLDFARQYESVFQNMLKSYRERQVSLLEFIDFADAYKDTRLKLLEQHTGLIKALAELNYLAGKDVVSLTK